MIYQVGLHSVIDLRPGPVLELRQTIGLPSRWKENHAAMSGMNIVPYMQNFVDDVPLFDHIAWRCDHYRKKTVSWYDNEIFDKN